MNFHTLLFFSTLAVVCSLALSAEAHLAQKQPNSILFSAHSASPRSRSTGERSLQQDPSRKFDEYTQPYPTLFSTHSASPWSRSRRRWSSWQASISAIANPTVSGRTIHVSSNVSFRSSEDKDTGADGDGDLEVWPCPDNLTLINSVRYILHGCKDDRSQVAHTVATIAWLMVLFYLLGSTASDYFSCTLEKLSDTLKLSPAVAGVTLLAVGNGAPDVFSSVAAFISSDKAGSIGLSCVLGGALFITTVVSGTVALVTDRGPNKASSQKINMVCFVRDALFLLASSAVLVAILLDGKVYLWEAALFLSLYVVYAICVWAAEVLDNRTKEMPFAEDPLLPKVSIESSLMQWTGSSPHMHYHQHSQEFEAELEYLFERDKNYPVIVKSERLMLLFYKYGIEWPLALPRRLTIPVIEEERWSRLFAIASCTLAPLFVGGVWVVQGNVSTELVYVILGASVCLGIVLGTLAFMNTEDAKPPCRFLWLWLGGGFFMSIVWFYIVADQVVASLETLGVLFSINPAILGLTVLAWGNCIGDLVADLALACGGRDGVQIAISGCYAGPLFNILVGLGLSLVIACWRSDPNPLLVTDDDGSLFFIIGFLVAGLLWALVMIPLNNMRLSKGLGAGLLLLYCSFLVAGMCYVMGWISR